MFCAYVLRSGRNGRLYKGSCKELGVRISKHDAGKVKSTKAFHPWKLVYSEEFESRSETFHREQYWETVKGAKELVLLLRDQARVCPRSRKLLRS